MLESAGRAASGRDAVARATLPPVVRRRHAKHLHVDPLEAERQRREYESLFASNVVLSRRPDALATGHGRRRSPRGLERAPASRIQHAVDRAVADAVVRATRRTVACHTAAPVCRRPGHHMRRRRPHRADARPVSADVSTTSSPHRVLEGTLIDAVLTNRLDGAMAAPVSCLVTNPVYALSGQRRPDPAGARVLGETRAGAGPRRNPPRRVRFTA